MRTTTTGLKSREIVSSIHTLNCNNCSGSGAIHHGLVNTVKGPMKLFDDCNNCSGKGTVSQTIKRAIRKTKSKVEILNV